MLKVRCIGLALVWLLPAPVTAAVYATVDRAVVQQNESFALTLTADAGEEGDPDVTGLDEHFEILGRSQSSSIALINGRREQSRRWTYTLIPKAAGNFTIPPLRVDGRASEPVTVNVQAVQAAAPGEAEVFFEVALDTEQSWVQAEVIYTIKLHFRVDVRQTSLTVPQVTGGEVIVERLADDRRYEDMIAGRTYQVIERSYALFPQASGTFTIEPARFTASLWERGRITSPRVFKSEALTLQVAPAVPPPPAFGNADWLPAKAVALSVRVDPEDGQLDPGEPANLRLVTSAIGLMANQLPELDLTEAAGLRIYPDQPDLRERAFPDGMRSAREQSFALIAGGGGVFSLPEVALPWFNVQNGAWEVAAIDLPTLRAAGPVQLSPPVATASSATQIDPPLELPADEVAPAPVTDDVRAELFRLRLANYLLLAAWLVTLWFFWRANGKARRSQRKARVQRDERAPFRATEKARKAVIKACNANDPHAAEQALVDWGRHFWAEHPPQSVGQIAARLTPEDGAIVQVLNAQRYGPGDQPGWNGRSLRDLLTRLHRAGVQTAATRATGLPPLYPEQGQAR
ncbi:MAG: BatD family protein [Pseudomonadota bacterium]